MPLCFSLPLCLLKGSSAADLVHVPAGPGSSRPTHLTPYSTEHVAKPTVPLSAGNFHVMSKPHRTSHYKSKVSSYIDDVPRDD